MNAKEILDELEEMNPLTFDDDERERYRITHAAFRLLAAAEANDGTTPETDAFIVKMERIGVRISPEAIDHAKQLEQRCNGLAARVAELEGDEARLRFLADEPLVDQFGEIDLHEEAAINASAFGRDEPNSNDYLAAIRTAIDAARSK